MPEIKKSSAVVMRIQVQGNPLLARSMHWRGIALTTFDGRRWYTEGHEPVAIGQDFDGWINVPRVAAADDRRTHPDHPHDRGMQIRGPRFDRHGQRGAAGRKRREIAADAEQSTARGNQHRAHIVTLT